MITYRGRVDLSCKIWFAVKTTHAPKEYKVSYSDNKALWREQWHVPKRSKNGLREQGGATGLGF